MFVNYDECILNYIASIRDYYGLDSSYAKREDFSNYLKSLDINKIFLVLIDGMGSRLIERKLDENSFLRRNLFHETSTVFPSTTTAATTSILNGKSPNENAWLGWTQYFKEKDDIIIPFLGKGLKNDYDENIVKELVEVDDMIHELNQKGIKAHEIYPAFRENGCKDFNEVCSRMIDESFNNQDPFTYVYWDAYDSKMHKLGVNNEESDNYLKEINDLLEDASNKLNEKTLMIIIADHGQVDIEKEINIYETSLNKYLIRPTTIEPRATAFFVKEEYKELFAKEFKESYADEFILLSHDEVIKTHLFGNHENHPKFEGFIGDFLAIAKDHTHFVYNDKPKDFKFKGSHAGCHIDELMIPVITYYKDFAK